MPLSYKKKSLVQPFWSSCILTSNKPLIQQWCARSKLNMDEFYSLNIYLWYVTMPKKGFIEIPPCAKNAILITELVTCAFLCSKSIYQKTACAWRNFKIFFSRPLFTTIFKTKMVSNLRKNFLCIVWHQKPTVVNNSVHSNLNSTHQCDK